MTSLGINSMLSNAVFFHNAIVVDAAREEISDKNHRHHRKVLITYSWNLLGFECRRIS